MVSFESVPLTAGLAPEGVFCSPTYPSEASVCTSVDDSPAVSGLLPWRAKWLSNDSNWEARVASIALGVCARFLLAPGAAERSYSSGLGERTYRYLPARHDSNGLHPKAC